MAVFFIELFHILVEKFRITWTNQFITQNKSEPMRFIYSFMLPYLSANICIVVSRNEMAAWEVFITADLDVDSINVEWLCRPRFDRDFNGVHLRELLTFLDVILNMDTVHIGLSFFVFFSFVSQCLFSFFLSLLLSLSYYLLIPSFVTAPSCPFIPSHNFTSFFANAHKTAKPLRD